MKINTAWVCPFLFQGFWLMQLLRAQQRGRVQMDRACDSRYPQAPTSAPT